MSREELGKAIEDGDAVGLATSANAIRVEKIPLAILCARFKIFLNRVVNGEEVDTGEFMGRVVELKTKTIKGWENIKLEVEAPCEVGARKLHQTILKLDEIGKVELYFGDFESGIKIKDWRMMEDGEKGGSASGADWERSHLRRVP